MTGNTNNTNKTIIGGNTIIQFTFKGFIATILTILGIFYSFYQLVIQPEVERTAEHQREMFFQQRDYINRELEEVKNAIQINTRAIEATNDRFKELNNSLSKTINTSGSLGDDSTANNDSTTNNEIDPPLADKPD